MVESSFDKIKRKTVEIISEQELKEILTSGKVLNVKLGADPTAPDLHLGHYVVLRKLRDFQQLGHRVVFIIGDFTGLVGDPSGRSKTRPPLSKEQIQENAKTYFDQVFKILDKEKTVVKYNSEWLSRITFENWFRLCANFTIARILERDDFMKRFNSETPIFLHELFYPIMQAYDSLAIEADVELGGTDQKFNLLMGRKLQEIMGMRPQIAVIMPILRGLDGSQKMSKSLGNYVGITEDPRSMFGKIMSIPDHLITEYFDLVLDYEPEEVAKISREIESGSENPMNYKLRLAKEVVALFHGQEAGEKELDNFIKVFRRKEAPEEMQEIFVNAYIHENKLNIVEMLVKENILPSKSEAKRLIEQGGIKINDIRISSFGEVPSIADGDILKVGKKTFFKMRIK